MPAPHRSFFVIRNPANGDCFDSERNMFWPGPNPTGNETKFRTMEGAQAYASEFELNWCIITRFTEQGEIDPMIDDGGNPDDGEEWKNG